MSFLFLPGTLIHELAHLIMSMILQVPVGSMELFPKEIESGIKLGSVQIGKTDPFRRMLIGMAPLLFGVLIIFGIFFYSIQSGLLNNKLSVLLISYIVFEIGNTMFSSKKDMEGFIELLITIIILTVIFYLIGIRLPAFNPQLFFSNILIQEIFKKVNLYLILPLGVDILLILILKIKKY